MMSAAKNTIATLIVACPDRHGLVAGLASFLTGHGANILHAEQHLDDASGVFFQRMQFDTAGMDSDRKKLESEIEALARASQMTWQISYHETLPRVAIFVSKFDHCLYDLVLRQRSRELRCDIRVIVSNHAGLRPVAGHFGIPFVHIPVSEDCREKAELAQMGLLQREHIDLVVLARYMQVLSAKFVAQYPRRIINIHHSFLPAFAGGRPYHQALEHGVKLIGATSHYVTENLDEGPIIEQDVVRVSHRDSLRDLVSRGRDIEKVVLARAVKAHLERRIVLCGSKTVVFN
jgi:formyltetrahydrofolate deformylase